LFVTSQRSKYARLRRALDTREPTIALAAARKRGAGAVAGGSLNSGVVLNIRWNAVCVVQTPTIS
jgi:hypothetical protein